MIYILEFTTELPKIFFIWLIDFLEKSESHVHKSQKKLITGLRTSRISPTAFSGSVYEQSVELMLIIILIILVSKHLNRPRNCLTEAKNQ